MHKVYINDKPLIFENVYERLNVGGEGMLILSESEFSLKEILSRIEENKTNGIIYLCSRPDQAWFNFTDRFVLIEAAGGLVVNENNDCLVIFRKKVWDLPKGKLDYDESPEQAAKREVKEECGIKKLKLDKFLLNTFHTYSEKNKFILKKTHWYSMSASSDEILIPESGEDIEKVSWMNKEKIHEIAFKNTYASIKDVFLKYFEKN